MIRFPRSVKLQARLQVQDAGLRGIDAELGLELLVGQPRGGLGVQGGGRQKRAALAALRARWGSDLPDAWYNRVPFSAAVCAE